MKLKIILFVGLSALSFACSGDDNDTDNNTTNNSKTNNNTTNNQTTNNNTNNTNTIGTTNNSNTNNSSTNNNTTNNSSTNNNTTNNNTTTNNTTNGIVCEPSEFPVVDSLLISNATGTSIGLVKEGATTFLQMRFSYTAEGANDSLLTGPGTYEFGAADTDDFNTCRSCIRIGTGCAPQAGCETEFIATKGTLVVTAFDEAAQTVEGTLTGLEAEEITVDGTSILTTVENGKLFCVETINFPATE